jgi:hypothetical protein
MSYLDPINDPENEDMSEVEVCRGCRELIEPGTEREFNDWFFHSRCLPVSVIEGREMEARDAERDGK